MSKRKQKQSVSLIAFACVFCLLAKALDSSFSLKICYSTASKMKVGELMFHGEVVRKIRLSKGLSQKEVYLGIVSKSYAIEFEKGNHSISATLLLDILERLSLDMDEFLYIGADYHLNPQSSYRARFSQASNRHDLTALQQLFDQLKNEPQGIATVHLAEVRSRIRIIASAAKTGVYDPTVVLPEDRQTIVSYLSQLQTWTLQEIQLFANTLEFIEAPQQLLFFKQLSKSLPRYQNYDRGKDIFCTLLVNLIQATLADNLLDYAEVLIQQLFLLSTGYEQFFQRLCGKYFEAVLRKKRGDASAQQDIQQLLQLLTDLDHGSLAEEMRSLL